MPFQDRTMPQSHESNSLPVISIPTLPQQCYTAPSPQEPMDESIIPSSDSQNERFKTRRSSSLSWNQQPTATRPNIAHPYARLIAQKEDTKRRKIWNHVLEKHIFTPYELSTLGAPHRRTIYIASLEAHIDKLHEQLQSVGCYPVDLEELEAFKGLNSKTAKSMVAGRQHEASVARLKILELERANEALEKELSGLEYENEGSRKALN